FSYDQFDDKQLQMNAAKFTMKMDVCCRLTGKSSGCSCDKSTEEASDCLSQAEKPTAENNEFYKKPSITAAVQGSSVVGFNEKESLLFLRNDIDIAMVNSSMKTVQAEYNSETGLTLEPGLVLHSGRRFFRVGTAEVSLETELEEWRDVWRATSDIPYGKPPPVSPTKMCPMFYEPDNTNHLVQGIPWSYLKRDPNSGEVMKDDQGKDIWEGYCLDLLKVLAESLKFDYEIVAPKNGKFGSRLPDGTWDGMVGDLAMGETDMIIAPLTMTSEREEVIDFVAPYFDQSGISIGEKIFWFGVISTSNWDISVGEFLTIVNSCGAKPFVSLIGKISLFKFLTVLYVSVIRKPVRKTSLFKFMTVLRLEVWLSIVGALTVTGIMIWLLDKYSPYSAQNNKAMYPYPCREFTLKESFWFALTSFTPQGGGEAPKALSGRTLVAAYWLFVVLMLATFTANLAAFLTVERMKSPVASLEQLARQSRINYTVVKDSDTHEYFKNMKNAEEVLYNVWKDITLNSSSDQSKYRVWDYPIKEQYGHILQAITQTGPVETPAIGFQKVTLMLEHFEEGGFQVKASELSTYLSGTRGTLHLKTQEMLYKGYPCVRQTVIDDEEGKFAFIHDAAQIRYEVSRNCNLTEVGEMFAEQPYAIAVQQGSHLQEEISRKILDLQKDRYFETLSGKYWDNSAKGTCPNTDDSEGITLESLGKFHMC
ncbi:unnamed protein product, partial [Timema podura]|nr:unnamed protein product [Timema podura]